MKRPQPDIGDVLKASFINNMGNARKFKRLWGTTSVQGVEVLNHRQYYYPTASRTANFTALFKFLKLYKDVTSSEPQGITSAWIYLNKNKNSTLPVLTPPSGSDAFYSYKDFVTSNLNQMWWDPADGPLPADLKLTTSIAIEAEIANDYAYSVNTTSLLSPSWTTTQLIQAITDNYETLWNTCHISQQGVGVINKGSITDSISNVVTPDEDDLSPNDPWLDVIARYALRYPGLPCTIKDVELGYAKNELGKRYVTYIVTLEIDYFVFNTDTPMVVDAVADLTAAYSSKTRSKLSYPNGYWTKSTILSMDSSDLVVDPTLITRPYRLWEDEATEFSNPSIPNIWVNLSGTWYIRAAAFDNPRAYGLTYKDLYNYILTLIDSGYQKKKVSWWKKALAIITFIVLVYVNPFGASSLAGAIVAASLVISLATLAFAAAGMDDWALAFAEASKTIEPLVKVASIYLAVTGLNQAYQSAKTAAQEAAVKTGTEVGKTAIDDIAKDLISDLAEDFINEITTGASDLFAGNLTSNSISFITKATKLLTLPSQIRLADIQERNVDLKNEYEQLLQEMSRENDVLRGFARIYAKPATADWSAYAAIFDHPYERGGGNLTLGNVQRTTKQALRKADYKDPAFDNILII